MNQIHIDDADQLRTLVNLMLNQDEPLTLALHGVPVAVLATPILWKKMVEALEDASDRESLAESRRDQDFVSWEQVKRDLNL